MFGIKERREARKHKLAETARKAAGQRASYPDAVREALRSEVPLVLWVGNIKIEGSKDTCTVTHERQDWYGPTYLLQQVKDVRRFLGRGYDVSGKVRVGLVVPSAGLAMDLASGYSNPRFHAANYTTATVTINSEADVERYRRGLQGVRNSSIYIAKR